MKGTKHEHDESHFGERDDLEVPAHSDETTVMRSLIMFLLRGFVCVKVVRVKKGCHLLQMTKAKPSVGAWHLRETTA